MKKMARLTPYDFGWKILQDLPFVLFDENYPLWLVQKRQDLPLVIFEEKIARLTPYDFDEKLLDLPLVILMKITPCD